MRLASWNVNGLRACAQKGFEEAFREIGADVFCVQETKMQKEQWDRGFVGYDEYWNSAVKKGYSGTAVFTRVKPLSAAYGMGIPEHDNEGRIITLEYGDFYLVNVYTPNSQEGLKRLEYRMNWEQAFSAYVNGLRKTKPVIICGDLNVAHTEIDLTHPKANRRNAGFTDEERAKLTELLATGFKDSFRLLWPDRREAYSWWSYRMNARERNVGWRIDYFLVSEEFADRIIKAEILPDVHGADHCPVVLEIS